MSTRTRAGDLILNVALVATGILVLLLLYSFGTRVLTPRTVPVREVEPQEVAETRLDPIQVEVRNASGTDGAAARTMTYLRRRGFDVIEVGQCASAATLNRCGPGWDGGICPKCRRCLGHRPKPD